MTDTQANGESTAIMSINTPVEIFASSSNEPTTASNSETQVKPQKMSSQNRSREARRNFLATEKYGDEHLSNQKKQRYWNSWEELQLVELWRRYLDEVTQINVSLPVYRKMVVAMRNRNMLVTTQDCRRKINTLNARYKQELKRVETTGYKSDWRLFSLIHCVLQPKIKDYDPWHENKVIKKLIDTLPKPVEEKPPPIPPPAPIIHSIPRQPLPPTLPFSTVSQFEKPSILPFRNITIQKIEQLRQDNNRLSAQRDDDLKCLHMEEENFRCFETFIRIWSEQKELELNRVKLLTQRNVSNFENGENHNMEQQLQETVAAK